MIKEQEIWKIKDGELDLLKDEHSRFIYQGSTGRRILVDNNESLPNSIKIRPRNRYIECTVNITAEGRQCSMSIGRYILDIKNSSLLVDHKNRNPLDNRRANLRMCDQSFNLANRENYTNNKYKCIYKRNNSIRIECTLHGVLTCISTYGIDIDEAAKIYDCLAISIHGREFACTNFDKNNYTDAFVKETLDSHKKNTTIRNKREMKTNNPSMGNRSYWKERCELAESLITSQNINTSTDEYKNWIEFKNQ